MFYKTQALLELAAFTSSKAKGNKSFDYVFYSKNIMKNLLMAIETVNLLIFNCFWHYYHDLLPIPTYRWKSEEKTSTYLTSRYT